MRHEAIRRLLDHIQLAPVDFDLIERLWLAARDLIQREQPKEVHVYFSLSEKYITFSLANFQTRHLILTLLTKLILLLPQVRGLVRLPLTAEVTTAQCVASTFLSSLAQS